MRKHVVLLCMDEMRGDCLGVAGYRSDVKTPHLDQFLAQGTVFRNHFCVMPKCVPSRISMMTGRYSHTDGFRTIHQHLPADHPDLVSRLKEEGFGVAVFGINHCWEDGFERVMDVNAWTEPYKRHWGPDSPFKSPPPETANRPVPDLPPGYDYGGCARSWFDDLVTDCAVEFIENQMPGDRPWFLQVNLQAPHPPYRVEEPYFSMYSGKIDPFPHAIPEEAPTLVRAQREHRTGLDAREEWLHEIQAVYFGMITKADTLMHRVITALDQAGILDDALVIYFSDHGDYAGQYGLVEKWDTHFADPLMRVAFGMVGDGIPAGDRMENLTEHIDVAPTVLDWLGLPPLETAHGRSLLATVASEEHREAVFADGGHEAPMRDRFNTPLNDNPCDPDFDGKQVTYQQVPAAMARAKMVRTATHKLVVRETGEHELYDLLQDPHELQNRFSDPALYDVERDLLLRLAGWSLRTDPDRPFQAKVGA